jgi:hypothetical protein
MRWVRSDDLTSDEPIEEHAHGRQVLFDRWLGVCLLQLLDIKGHVDGLNPSQPVDASALAPSEKLPDIVVVGDPGVLVSNRCGEEFQEPPHGIIACVGDERRNDGFCRVRGEGPGWLVGDELAHGFSVHNVLCPRVPTCLRPTGLTQKPEDSTTRLSPVPPGLVLLNAVVDLCILFAVRNVLDEKEAFMVILVRGVPVIPGQTTLRKAFERIIGSERSGCVVLQEGGARLYHFDTIDQQMPERAERPIEEFTDNTWVPSVERESIQSSSAAITLLSHSDIEATLGFMIDTLAKDFYNAVRVYRCNIDPFNHYFSAMKVKSFPPYPGGGYQCPTKDGGQLT